MKIKAMLITTLIAFVQPVNADIVKDIKSKFINSNIFEYQGCVEKLVKQDLSKYISNHLCIDRHSSKLKTKQWQKIKSTASPGGMITLSLKNISNSFVIKKINFSGYAQCYSVDPETENREIDGEVCSKQNFDYSTYTDIEPKSTKEISTWISQFEIPDEVAETKDWSWVLDSITVYGIEVSY